MGMAALAVIVGCGPNYRYVYDGESAFERCYANDFDPNLGPAARSRCWQEWLQSFSYGGATDRVEYARSRVTALEAPAAAPADAAAPSPSPADTTPERPGAPTAAPTATATTPPPAGLPPRIGPGVPAAGLGPAAPPSPERRGPALGEPWRAATATSLPSTAPTPTQTPPEAEPPGAACAAACRVSWQSAAGRCAQRDAACVAHSDEGYRDCMRGCF